MEWLNCYELSFLQGISRVPRIAENYNPATWMLDITSASMEQQLGVDYAHLYKMSTMYQYVQRKHQSSMII